MSMKEKTGIFAQEAQPMEDAKERYIKGLYTETQAVQALFEDGYSFDEAEAMVHEWKMADEALYESSSLKEGLFTDQEADPNEPVTEEEVADVIDQADPNEKMGLGSILNQAGDSTVQRGTLKGLVDPDKEAFIDDADDDAINTISRSFFAQKESITTELTTFFEAMNIQEASMDEVYNGLLSEFGFRKKEALEIMEEQFTGEERLVEAIKPYAFIRNFINNPKQIDNPTTMLGQDWKFDGLDASVKRNPVDVFAYLYNMKDPKSGKKYVSQEVQNAVKRYLSKYKSPRSAIEKYLADTGLGDLLAKLIHNSVTPTTYTTAANNVVRTDPYTQKVMPVRATSVPQVQQQLLKKR